MFDVVGLGVHRERTLGDDARELTSFGCGTLLAQRDTRSPMSYRDNCPSTAHPT